MATRRAPSPHIWRRDADALYEQYGELSALARDRVLMDGVPGAFVLVLPTNPGWDDPNELDELRGIDPNGVQAANAETAIALRVLGELMALDTLQAWTRREIAKRETKKLPGAPILARDLLATGAPIAPSRAAARPRTPGRDPVYRAMLRKVEEWAAGTYKRPAGANALRVALLRGGSIAAAQAFLRWTAPTIGVIGLWVYSDDEPHVAYVHTSLHDDDGNVNLDAIRLAQDVLANFGQGFIASVEAAEYSYAEYATPHLTWLFGLQVEVNFASEA